MSKMKYCLDASSIDDSSEPKRQVMFDSRPIDLPPPIMIDPEVWLNGQGVVDTTIAFYKPVKKVNNDILDEDSEPDIKLENSKSVVHFN